MAMHYTFARYANGRPRDYCDAYACYNTFTTWLDGIAFRKNCHAVYGAADDYCWNFHSNKKARVVTQPLKLKSRSTGNRPRITSIAVMRIFYLT